MYVCICMSIHIYIFTHTSRKTRAEQHLRALRDRTSIEMTAIHSAKLHSQTQEPTYLLRETSLPFYFTVPQKKKLPSSRYHSLSVL